MKGGNYFTIDDLPQYIYMAISIALTVLVAGTVLEIIENVMRVGTGYVTMVAILTVIPVIVIALGFVFAVVYLYRKFNAEARLLRMFLLVTGIQVLLYGVLRWTRITVVTAIMGGTREQTLTLAGYEGDWPAYVSAGVGVLFMAVSAVISIRSPRR